MTTSHKVENKQNKDTKIYVVSLKHKVRTYFMGEERERIYYEPRDNKEPVIPVTLNETPNDIQE